MKKPHMMLILFSVFLYGCASTSPKMTSVAKPDVAPLSLRSPDRFDQYQISLDNGLRNQAPELFEGSRPHRANTSSSSVNSSGLNYSKWGEFFSEGTATNSFEQEQALLKSFADCATNLVFNGSPPHPSRMAGKSVDYIGLDCRGRDMSLIDDAATK